MGSYKSILTNLDLKGNEIKSVSLSEADIEHIATAPSNPTDGRIYWNTTTSRLNIYFDGIWYTLAPDSTGSTEISATKITSPTGILTLGDIVISRNGDTITIASSSSSYNIELKGKSSDSDMLGGQTPDYYLNAGNLTGKLPSSVIPTDLANYFRYKGESTFSNLPTTNIVGDVYSITDDFSLSDGGVNRAGTSVYWNGSEWKRFLSLSIENTISATSTNAISSKAVNDAIKAAVSSLYKSKGSITFANLLLLTNMEVGDTYNVSDAFVTTDAFAEGPLVSYPAGTNVTYLSTGKWDCLTGIYDLTPYQKINEPTLYTNNKTIPGAINEINVTLSNKVNLKKDVTISMTANSDLSVPKYRKLFTIPNGYSIRVNSLYTIGSFGGESEIIMFNNSYYGELVTLMTDFVMIKEKQGDYWTVCMKEQATAAPKGDFNFQVEFYTGDLSDITWYSTAAEFVEGSFFDLKHALTIQSTASNIDYSKAEKVTVTPTYNRGEIDMVNYNSFIVNSSNADSTKIIELYNGGGSGKFNTSYLYNFSFANKITNGVSFNISSTATTAREITITDTIYSGDVITLTPVTDANGTTTWTYSTSHSSILSSDGTVQVTDLDGSKDLSIATELSTKQDKLTFDTTPTKDSTNPVTSGGLKTALDAITLAAGSGIQIDSNRINYKVFNNSYTVNNDNGEIKLGTGVTPPVYYYSKILTIAFKEEGLAAAYNATFIVGATNWSTVNENKLGIYQMFFSYHTESAGVDHAVMNTISGYDDKTLFAYTVDTITKSDATESAKNGVYDIVNVYIRATIDTLVPDGSGGTKTTYQNPSTNITVLNQSFHGRLSRTTYNNIDTYYNSDYIWYGVEKDYVNANKLPNWYTSSSNTAALSLQPWTTTKPVGTYTFTKIPGYEIKDYNEQVQFKMYQFDTTPTAGSTNPVTSGGIRTDLGDLTTLKTDTKTNLVAAINEVENEVKAIAAATNTDIDNITG